MEQNIEQNIPYIPIIIGFIILLVSTQILRKKLRDKFLISQGQLSLDGVNVASIEQRVAANKSWASGKIRSANRSLMVLLWVTAIAWNLSLGVSFIKSLSNPEIPVGGKIALGVLAALGIVPLGFAIRTTIQRFRYGESWCCINGKAGVLGNTMTGFIRTAKDVNATGDYIIELNCIESYESGSGKNRSTHTRSHWQHKQSIPKTGKNSCNGIPFSFDLPTHTPETGYQLARGTINWQVKISAPTEGVDYTATFVVPVFNME